MKNSITHLQLVILISYCLSPSFAQVQLGNNLNSDLIDYRYGQNIALSKYGNRIAIGSPAYDNNNGRIQIFEWTDDEWSQVGNDIKGQFHGQNLGISVSLSGDGERLVATAKDSHSFYLESLGQISVHEWDGQDWIVTNSDVEKVEDYYVNNENIKASISEDGNHIIVAKRWDDIFEQNGQVTIYKKSGNDWVQKGDIIFGEEEFNDFGAAIDISADGNQILVGNPLENFGSAADLGTVRIYEWNSSNWVKKGQTIKGFQAESEIGAFAALSPDGDYLIYGDRYVDFLNNFFIVRVMKWNGSTWEEWGNSFTPFTDSQSIIGDHLRVDISENGNVIAISDPQQNTSGTQKGQIAFYQKEGDQWIQIGQQLSGGSEGAKFGTHLVLSNDGKRLALGSPLAAENQNSGLIKVFSLQASTASNEINPTEILIHPNLTTGILYFEDPTITEITVYDNNARTLKKIQSPNQQLDLSELISGVYFLKVFSSEGIQTLKVIKY